MKRVLAALIAVVALLGSVVVAQAATLTLDAGTLQTLHVSKSPEIPDASKHQLTVELWERAGASGNVELADTWKYQLPVGSHYSLSWSSERPTERSCPTPTSSNTQFGDFGPLTADTLHMVCLQQGTGGSPVVETVEPPS
jgi:hypothetical protein